MMNLYKKNTSPRNFRYQPFPQVPFVPEAPYSGACTQCGSYGSVDAEQEKKNKMSSAGVGLILGMAFLLFLPVLVSQAEADMKKASKGA